MSSKLEFICKTLHPLDPSIQERGKMTAEQVLEFVKNYDWTQDLKAYKDLTSDNVKNTPAIQLEELFQEQTLIISNVSTDYTDYKYFITFKRPVVLSYLWGLFSRLKKNYTSQKKIKTDLEMEEILQNFLNSNLETL